VRLRRGFTSAAHVRQPKPYRDGDTAYDHSTHLLQAETVVVTEAERLGECGENEEDHPCRNEDETHGFSAHKLLPSG
jgi:hypothetical protein